MADRDRFGGNAMSYSRPRDSSSYGDYSRRGLEGLRGTIGRPPMPGETGRSLGPAGGPLPPTGRSLRDIFANIPDRPTLGPGLDRIGNLPGAKPPTYIVDQITDALGIGDRRKERYIAATQGGYPNVGMRKGIGSLGEGFYGRDGEFVEVPLGGAEDRLDSILGDILSPTYEGFSPSFPGNLDVRYPGDFITSGQNRFGDQTAVDPSDWRVIQQILNAGGDPDDYVQTAGIMGAMPEERQMAELTQDQMNMMGNPLNTPDFGVSKEDLWNRTKDMEDQGFFGWGAQEPTTREEFEDYYRQLQAGTAGNWVT
tara:strand:+ start:44 stop:976 length:933 start_codon:yes stop_codon:yes gene_type:complete